MVFPLLIICIPPILFHSHIGILILPTSLYSTSLLPIHLALFPVLLLCASIIHNVSPKLYPKDKLLFIKHLAKTRELIL